MANWFKRMLESDEDREARQLKALRESEEFKTLLVEQAAELIQETQNKKDEEEAQRKEKVEQAHETITLLSEEMQESSEPYVIVRSLSFTPEQGIKVKLDYNPAFIKYLTASGLTGKNEDEIIRHWLAILSHNIVQESREQDYIMNGVDEDETPLGEFADILREIQAEQDDDEDESDTRWE